MGSRGAVASPHYLATEAGFEVLVRGGNAVDAAIATDLALSVVTPDNTGVGGDAFWLIYDGRRGEVVAVNGSGRSPKKSSIDYFRKKSLGKIPGQGIHSVTVPGAAHSWCAVHQRYGKYPFAELFQRAIQYAREGFPIDHRLCAFIKANEELISREKAAAAVFLADRQWKPGDTIVQRDLASTLETISKDRGESFYKGEIARKIVWISDAVGGWFSMADFEDHATEWAPPIKTTYRGYEVLTHPPNSQGLALLMELNIMEHFPLADLRPPNSRLIHLQVEAKKQAFKDRDLYIADPDFADVPVEKLLSKEHAAEMRAQISLRKASAEVAYEAEGDTVSITTADADGNAVSLISSLSAHFGSGVMVGGTGILLQNRGRGFSLREGHPNMFQPGKRPFHTLVPCMIMNGGAPRFTLGTRGAHGQPQVLLQLINLMIDFDLPPQEALDLPRWMSGSPYYDLPWKGLTLESRFPVRVVKQLKNMGHKVKVVGAMDEMMGYAQAIAVDRERGTFEAGFDPRSDGLALAY